MKKTTPSFVRAYNRYNILTTIRVAELISRVDIAKSIGLSQASITGITADLISEGLIEEKKPGAYEGGRPPILLAISPDGAYEIGINLTIEKIDVAITNFQAEIKAFHSIELDSAYYRAEDLVDMMAQAVQKCMWEGNFSKDQISGIGIGIPGLVDSESGIIRFLPNYGWENINFRDLFQEKIGIPTYIENSSNTLALAEQWFGFGKGIDNFIVVTLQNGVGAGCIINGQLSRGNTGIAGEFGHLTMDPEGPLCRCGKKGCIEAYAGNNSLMRDAKNAALKGVWNKKKPEHLTFEDLLRAVHEKEPEILKFYHRAGKALGMGITHLITLLNPEKIFITGKGVQAENALFDPMFQAVNKFVSPKFEGYGTQIIIKEWSETDWVRGAGTLVLNEIYKSPTIKPTINPTIT
jgi:glucokinase-like ROK family protein